MDGKQRTKNEKINLPVTAITSWECKYQITNVVGTEITTQDKTKHGTENYQGCNV